jgi:hypothetical protein
MLQIDADSATTPPFMGAVMKRRLHGSRIDPWQVDRQTPSPKRINAIASWYAAQFRRQDVTLDHSAIDEANWEVITQFDQLAVPEEATYQLFRIRSHGNSYELGVTNTALIQMSEGSLRAALYRAFNMVLGQPAKRWVVKLDGTVIHVAKPLPPSPPHPGGSAA